MTDILKISSEIIEDGNLNKLNNLLNYPMTDDLAKTLRRIFFYLEDQKFFVIKYGSEWSQWFCENYEYESEGTQVDKFLNTKWSVFIRLLFQQQFYDELLKCVKNAINCPPYIRLVQTAIEKGIELPVDSNFIKVLQIMAIDFEKFIILLKRLPTIEDGDKAEFSTFIQQQIVHLSQDEEKRLIFSKMINTHVVDKIENPLILADFLQKNIEQGGLELKINSLQSMLILMTRYHFNLENFYDKLLQIISADEAFDCSSTPKLLKIIDVATKSSKVPLKTLCEIIQLVLRRCVLQSCSLQLWAISLTFNIFKKHPTIRQYLQSGESQINEIASYQDHWHPEIKRIVGYLQDDLNIFDFFNLNDLVELNDQQLLEAQF